MRGATALMICVLNRQRRVKVQLRWVRKAAAAALPLCRSVSDDEKFALQRLSEITVAIVTDAEIARIHEEFIEIAGPTDVITFEHGDIVVSAETAQSYAAQHGHTVDEELLLYTIHGLLHLNGFDDQTTPAATRMRLAQERIWREVLASSPLPDPHA